MAHALYVLFSLGFIFAAVLSVGIPAVLFMGWLDDNYPKPTESKPPHPPVEWL